MCWDYEPPDEIRAIRVEQERFGIGLAVGNATFSEQVVVSRNSAFLVRSLQMDRSDLLAAIRIDDVLDDGSIIIVWKLLSTFDTPVARDPSNAQP